MPFLLNVILAEKVSFVEWREWAKNINGDIYPRFCVEKHKNLIR